MKYGNRPTTGIYVVFEVGNVTHVLPSAIFFHR